MKENVTIQTRREKEYERKIERSLQLLHDEICCRQQQGGPISIVELVEDESGSVAQSGCLSLGLTSTPAGASAVSSILLL